MRPHPSTKKPMLFLVAVALMALIASPSVASDRDAERIVTRQVASIVPPDQIGQVAQEPVPEPGTARVETLKGEEYVRVWINKDGMSYLIYLPIPL